MRNTLSKLFIYVGGGLMVYALILMLLDMVGVR